MKVQVISIPVLDQSAALQFYTEKLGFVKKMDIPLSENNRWLTVVSKEQPEGPEILLEPAPQHFEPAKQYQQALFEAGIPYTQFTVDDLDEEYERLQKDGVEFSMTPMDMGTVRIAVFRDTCGNHIQLVQMI